LKPKFTIQIFVSLVCSLVMAIAVAGYPVPGHSQVLPSPDQPSLPSLHPGAKVYRLGDLEYTALMLDGQVLFNIATETSEARGELSPVKVRAQLIEDNLYQVVRSGFEVDTFRVTVGDLNEQTVILAYDLRQLHRQVLLTVTSADARVARQPIESLAEEWAEILEERLIQAVESRQPEIRRQQSLKVLAIALIMLVSTSVLETLRRRLRRQLKAAQGATQPTPPPRASPSFPDPFTTHLHQLNWLKAWRPFTHRQQRQELKLFFMQLIRFSQVMVWVRGITWSLGLFPETRLLGRWFSTVPLQILVICLVMAITVHIAHSLMKRSVQDWVDQQTVNSDNPERILLRAPTIVNALQSIANLSTWGIGLLWFLTWQNVSLSSIITGAGLVGVALGFVFQNLLRDWVNGILVVLEDQYTVGDAIDIGGTFGFVEHVGLRAVQIRADGGRLSTIPHGQASTVHNFSKDWSRVDFTINVAYETDATQAMEVMEQVAMEMANDPQWHQDILDPKNLIGVSRVDHSGIQLLLWIKTRRLRQWAVEREFRTRLKIAFEQKGIKIGVPQRSLSWHDHNP
jgi:small conductance mechanosensitive channel